MTSIDAVAYFFGGVFLANSVTHLVAGVSGRQFPTPFAKPPFRGPSPPPMNVLYGLLNLTVAYSLIMLVGTFEPRHAAQAAVLAAGFGLAAAGIGWRVSKLPDRRHCQDPAEGAK